MGIYIYHVESYNIKQVKGKLSKVLKGQKHVHTQMPCKSSLFSPVFYNAILFSSCTHGSGARRKISGIFIGKKYTRRWQLLFQGSGIRSGPSKPCQNNNVSHYALKGTANTVEVPKQQICEYSVYISVSSRNNKFKAQIVKACKDEFKQYLISSIARKITVRETAQVHLVIHGHKHIASSFLRVVV